jgi:hypothetical protein
VGYDPAEAKKLLAEAGQAGLRHSHVPLARLPGDGCEEASRSDYIQRHLADKAYYVYVPQWPSTSPIRVREGLQAPRRLRIDTAVYT